MVGAEASLLGGLRRECGGGEVVVENTDFFRGFCHQVEQRNGMVAQEGPGGCFKGVPFAGGKDLIEKKWRRQERKGVSAWGQS